MKEVNLKNIPPPVAQLRDLLFMALEIAVNAGQLEKNVDQDRRAQQLRQLGLMGITEISGFRINLLGRSITKQGTEAINDGFNQAGKMLELIEGISAHYAQLGFFESQCDLELLFQAMLGISFLDIAKGKFGGRIQQALPYRELDEKQAHQLVFFLSISLEALSRRGMLVQGRDYVVNSALQADLLGRIGLGRKEIEPIRPLLGLSRAREYRGLDHDQQNLIITALMGTVDNYRRMEYVLQSAAETNSLIKTQNRLEIFLLWAFGVSWYDDLMPALQALLKNKSANTDRLNQMLLNLASLRGQNVSNN
jgi:hypothetical protein